MNKVTAHRGGNVEESLVDIIFCDAESVMLRRTMAFKYSVEDIIDMDNAFPALGFLVNSFQSFHQLPIIVGDCVDPVVFDSIIPRATHTSSEFLLCDVSSSCCISVTFFQIPISNNAKMVLVIRKC